MEIALEQDDDGAWPAVTLPTGARHKIILRRPVLEIERRYHDDKPVHGAPFTVELANGKTIEGKLSAAGEARVPLPARARRIQFGPDERDWTLVDAQKNPDHQDELGDVDAFVGARFTRT